MTGRRRPSGAGRRIGAGIAVVLTVLVATPASPAAAKAIITVDQPRATPPLDSASVTISGKVESDAPLLNTIKRVTLTLPGKQPFSVACTESPCPFKWTTSLPLNGAYSVVVEATEATLLGIELDTVKQPHGFKVAAPPAKPVLDPPKVTAGRTVELAWTRNTEPDMRYYAVFRKDPGRPDFSQVGANVAQPSTGSRVTFTDTTTPALNGGDYAYRVVAVRRGVTDDPKDEKVSDPASGAATIPVEAPTTAAPPPPGSPAAGPTTTAKPAPPAGVDLSKFLSSRSQPVTLPPITVPEPPDPGFTGTLPFGARPPGEELEEGEAEAVLPDDLRRPTSVISRMSDARPLVPVAGGLILLMLALHMRMLSRRVKPAADGDLPVDLHVPGEPVELRAEAASVVASEHPSALYDIGAEDDWTPLPADPGALPPSYADTDEAELASPSSYAVAEEEQWTGIVEVEPEEADEAEGELVSSSSYAVADEEEEQWTGLVDLEEEIEPEPEFVSSSSYALADEEEEQWTGLVEVELEDEIEPEVEPGPSADGALDEEPWVPVAAGEWKSERETPTDDFDEAEWEAEVQPTFVAESDEEDWAPVVAAPPEPEPTYNGVDDEDWEPVPEPEPEQEFEVVAFWSPPTPEAIETEPEEPEFDPEAIEVVEMVSPVRRRLARAGRP